MSENQKLNLKGDKDKTGHYLKVDTLKKKALQANQT